MLGKLQNLKGKETVIQLLLFLVAAKSTANELHSTCSAKNIGTSGRVECTFNVNINKSKDNFVIQRYDFETGGAPDRVVSCIWTAVGLKCHVDPDYHLDYHVSSKVVVEIPQIDKAHEGRYYCYGIPAENGQADVCELRIAVDEKDSQEPVKCPSLAPAGTASQNPDDNNVQYLYLIIGLETGVLLTLAVVVIFRRCYLKRKANRKTNGPRQDSLACKPLMACNGVTSRDSYIGVTTLDVEVTCNGHPASEKGNP